MRWKYTLLPLAAVPLLYAGALPGAEECVCGDVCPCHEPEKRWATEAVPGPQSAWVGLKRVLETIDGLREEGVACEPLAMKAVSRPRAKQGDRVEVDVELDFPAENTRAAARAHAELETALRCWRALETLGSDTSEPLPEGRGLHIGGTKLVLDLSPGEMRRIPAGRRLEPGDMECAIRNVFDAHNYGLVDLKFSRRETREGTWYQVRVNPADRRREYTWSQVTGFPEAIERRHPDLVVTALTLVPGGEDRNVWTFSLELTLRK